MRRWSLPIDTNSTRQKWELSTIQELEKKKTKNKNTNSSCSSASSSSQGRSVSGSPGQEFFKIISMLINGVEEQQNGGGQEDEEDCCCLSVRVCKVTKDVAHSKRFSDRHSVDTSYFHLKCNWQGWPNQMFGSCSFCFFFTSVSDLRLIKFNPLVGVLRVGT